MNTGSNTWYSKPAIPAMLLSSVSWVMVVFVPFVSFFALINRSNCGPAITENFSWNL